MSESCDFLIVGAGIIGLSIAREIKRRQPNAAIVVLEKEACIGLHASGRNSGVLHTGIYYPPATLKARLCKAGADAMFAFAETNRIPVRRDGKVIVATSESEAQGLQLLLANAAANRITARRLSGDEIRQIEPHARADFGGIHCQDTAVVDSLAVLNRLQRDLEADGVRIVAGQQVRSIDDQGRVATTATTKYSYGRLINAAGAYADQVARLADAGRDYRLVPFKGLYFKLAPDGARRIRGSIYPVPNPALPFLGIHFTRVISNDVYIGPTAIPALGRENYGIVSGARPLEALGIGWQLARLYARNPQNFRSLVHNEVPHYRASSFLAAARKLVDRLDPAWVKASPKVGIRPQLLNLRTGRLEMDFVIEHGRFSTHVLNAISPAFTSAFAFADFVVNEMNLQCN